ncbi:MAG TPA: CPBP family intramembrane metalloprotease [Clostridiales bacterium]|nr:CPBP family intramembrane metalloprotease [Clostridiales bacterium]
MHDLKQEHTINDHELWSKVSRNLFILIAIILSVQMLIEIIMQGNMPELRNEDWYSLVLSIISIDIIAFPIFYVLMRNIPNSNTGIIKRMGTKNFVIASSMCLGLGFIGNIIGLIFNIIFTIIKGGKIVNPAIDMLQNGNPIFFIIYGVILAPIVEEIIFRKLLLDKIRRYGDLIAVLTSGIAFGLMHMNLHQFFYATALGIMFAYITIKTNTIRYSIAIHMLINLSATIMGLLLAKEEYVTYAIIFVLIYLTVLTAGICLLLINFKKIKFEVADVIILDKKKIIFNSWTMCYILICIIFVILNILN